jgi:uncharacterized protein YggE
MPKISLPFLLIALWASALAEDRKTSHENPPSLSVTGSGEVERVPDQVTVQLGVTHQSATAQGAQEGANSTIERVLRALADLDINPEQIQTSRIYLQPVYDTTRGARERQEPRIVGYRANYSLRVQTGELERISRIVDSSLEAGANQLGGIHFGLQNEGPARREALQKAVEDANAKAGALAEAAGLQLRRIQEIREGNVAVRPVVMSRTSMMSAEAVGASTPIMPGQVTVSAAVTIRYAIGVAEP